jgi:hypothetical protein
MFIVHHTVRYMIIGMVTIGAAPWITRMIWKCCNPPVQEFAVPGAQMTSIAAK